MGSFSSPPEDCTPPQRMAVSTTLRTATPVSSSSRTFWRRTPRWLSSLRESSAVWHSTGADVL